MKTNIRTLIDKFDDGKPSLAAKRRKLKQRTLAYYYTGERVPTIDQIELVAKAYDLLPWQLLIPGLDPANPPILNIQSKEERDLYERLKSTFAEIQKIK